MTIEEKYLQVLNKLDAGEQDILVEYISTIKRRLYGLQKENEHLKSKLNKMYGA